MLHYSHFIFIATTKAKPCHAYAHKIALYALLYSMNACGTHAVAQPSARAGSDRAEPEIIVTGSQLQRMATQAAGIETLTREDIATRAPVNLADMLNELPNFRTTSAPSQAQRIIGSGVNALDLHGLGVVRTLVLVDGERFTPTLNTGVFDLGMIPSSLIKRIDIVSGGASAAYGSDAIAGAVNTILDTKIHGLRADIHYGVSQEGDNAQPNLHLAWGNSFAGGRGHWLFAGEGMTSSGVGTLTSRDWGRQLPGLIAYGTRAPDVPAQAFLNGVTYSAQSAGGLISSGPLKGTAFGVGGTPFAFSYGTLYGSLMTGGSNAQANPYGNWPLNTPEDRAVSMVRLSYALTPALEFYVQGHYGRIHTANFSSYNQASFTLAASNPYLPTSLAQLLAASKISSFSFGRLLTETQGLRQSNIRETAQASMGAKGKLWGFDWDAHALYGATQSNTRIFQDVISANYKAAVYAVASPQGLVCGALASNPNLTPALAAQVQPGCVPINLFGQGAPSAAALNYITGTALTQTLIQHQSLGFSLHKNLFATQAGIAKLALGVQQRRDSLNVSADSNSAQGLYATGNTSPTLGSMGVREAFAEFGLPLLPALNLDAAVRRTDYTTTGSATTWKLGAAWDATQDVHISLARSRDIRAPNLAELYAQSGRAVTGASGINSLNGKTGVLYSSLSGNPALLPEIANTLSAAMVFQPHNRAVRLQVNAYTINVRQVIATLNAQQIVNNCAAGATLYCQQISFDSSSFGIYNVATKPQNLAQLETSGLDIEARAPIPLPILGKLQARVLANYVFSLATTDSSGTVDRAGSLQGGGTPRYSVNGTLAYSLADFSTALNARYIPRTRFDATLFDASDAGYNAALPNSININHFPAALTFNLQASHALKFAHGKAAQLSFNIDNLFNTAPPAFAVIGLNLGGNPYDLIGRRFTLGFHIAP
jgi:iron complex outermembrane recepter protein